MAMRIACAAHKADRGLSIGFEASEIMCLAESLKQEQNLRKITVFGEAMLTVEWRVTKNDSDGSFSVCCACCTLLCSSSHNDLSPTILLSHSALASQVQHHARESDLHDPSCVIISCCLWSVDQLSRPSILRFIVAQRVAWVLSHATWKAISSHPLCEADAAKHPQLYIASTCRTHALTERLRM